MRYKFTLILLVFVALLPLEAIAMPGVVWRKPVIKVRDFSPPEWQEAFAEMVATFNATLPKRAPRLVHVPMGERLCRNWKRDARKGAIVVCFSASLDKDMDTTYEQARNQIDRVVIQVNNTVSDDWSLTPIGRRRAACHELMHAITGMPDGNKSGLDGSCVQGIREDPGPFDIAFVKRVYGKHGGHESVDRRGERRN